MSAPKWTPGPYFVNEVADEGGSAFEIRTEVDDLLVAEIYDLLAQDQENARLIAAAPGLYEALAEFVWRMDTDEANPVSFEHLANKARAALAKARGEQEDGE